jgi:Protein of unknown function (DUF998)
MVMPEERDGAPQFAGGVRPNENRRRAPSKGQRSDHRIDAHQLSVMCLIGIGLYVIIDIVLAALRPELSLTRNPDADYGRGAYWWLMDINFVVLAGLSVSLWQAVEQSAPFEGGKESTWRWGKAMLTAWSGATVLLVFFADDIKGHAHTSSGLTHQTLTLVAYAAICLGMVSTTLAVRLDRRFQRVAPLLMVASLGAVVGFFLWGGANATPHSLSGLFQRIFLGCVLAWFGLLANRIRGLRRSSTSLTS